LYAFREDKVEVENKTERNYYSESEENFYTKYSVTGFSEEYFPKNMFADKNLPNQNTKCFLSKPIEKCETFESLFSFQELKKLYAFLLNDTYNEQALIISENRAKSCFEGWEYLFNNNYFLNEYTLENDKESPVTVIFFHSLN